MKSKYFQYIDIYGNKIVINAEKIVAIQENTLFDKSEDSHIMLDVGDKFTTIFTESNFFEVKEAFDGVSSDICS